jgi:hypothetical protein
VFVTDFRTRAADLPLPGADCFVFDHRLVRWNFQKATAPTPAKYTFSSGLRTVRGITAAFEIAWNRARQLAELRRKYSSRPAAVSAANIAGRRVSRRSRAALAVELPLDIQPAAENWW